MGTSPPSTPPAAERPATGSSDDSPPGTCPECRAALRASDVLIEYDVDGQREAFAECPACSEVVSPV
ncbi:DUF7837 family putative zinc-binding protein [Halobacterium jilantaiense]|uniref:DUF7837 domain-containing protein n=1 Tax=Halobacterium jilantaiense TaxID=355548 RepID=A0A1I0P8R0_9EURY|nr:hypothetical protein SAMN04487945_1482 [Halobacterium jilantaiense]